MDVLTELDAMILGVVGLHGPCTGYRIRRVFRESLSPYWSGSAGAVYPALERLDGFGLIDKEDDPTTRRPSKLLSLNREGRRALSDWLAPPLGSSELMDVDPLRVRVRMLGLVPVALRRRFVTAAREELAAIELKARELLEKSRLGTDPYHTLVCKGAVDSLRVRQKWLSEVENEVC